jgi:hypothetical protein
VLLKVTDPTPETPVFSMVSETPNNIYNNINNNNINNYSNNQNKNIDQFIAVENKNEKIENTSDKDLIDNPFFTKPVSEEEKRLSDSGKIFKILKSWDFMKFPENTPEQQDRIIANKIRQFNNLDMLNQMIESIKNNPELKENNDRCRMLNYFFKNPDKFNYSPGIMSDQAYEKLQKQIEYLQPLKEIFKIRVVKNPDDILSEFADKIVNYADKASMGYTKAADDLIKETIRQAKENHKNAPRLFPEVNQEKVLEIHNRIHDSIEQERIEFTNICNELKKAFTPNQLKHTINNALKNNQNRGKIKSFCSHGINTAVVKIMRAISSLVKDFQFNDKIPAPEPEQKIITIENIREKKQVKDGLQPLKEVIKGYLPHSENNPELLDYIASNIKIEG